MAAAANTQHKKMTAHICKTTLVETPEQARARVFRMDKIEHRLEWLEPQIAKRDAIWRIVLTLDEAIAVLEREEQDRAEIRRAG